MGGLAVGRQNDRFLRPDRGGDRPRTGKPGGHIQQTALLSGKRIASNRTKESSLAALRAPPNRDQSNTARRVVHARRSGPAVVNGTCGSWPRVSMNQHGRWVSSTASPGSLRHPHTHGRRNRFFFAASLQALEPIKGTTETSLGCSLISPKLRTLRQRRFSSAS